MARLLSQPSRDKLWCPQGPPGHPHLRLMGIYVGALRNTIPAHQLVTISNISESLGVNEGRCLLRHAIPFQVQEGHYQMNVDKVINAI